MSVPSLTLVVCACAAVALVWDHLRLSRRTRPAPRPPVDVDITLPAATWTICTATGDPVGSVKACTRDALLTGALVCLEAQGHQLLAIKRGEA